MPYRPFRTLIVVALTLFSVTAVACRGDDDSSAVTAGIAQTPATDATVPAPTVTVRATRTPRPRSSVVTGSIKTATATTLPASEASRSSPTQMGPTPTIPPVPTSVPPPPPASVVGDGTALSDAVTFPEGVAVVTMNHDGDGVFSVRLQRLDKSFDRLIGSGTGTWKGSKGIFISQPGDYVFSVEASGSWQIDVQWPTPETAPVSEEPFQYSGTGDQAVYFVIARTGEHTTTISHDGAGNYTVETMTSEGRRYINTFHGTGQTSASSSFVVRGKAFEFLLFNIRANGNWTISVQ